MGARGELGWRGEARVLGIRNGVGKGRRRTGDAGFGEVTSRWAFTFSFGKTMVCTCNVVGSNQLES
jgi:hypothetical protein